MSYQYASILSPLAPYFMGTQYAGQRGGANDNMSTIIGLLVSLFAAYLAWNCSAFETTAMRTFYTIIAFLFGGFYLIYYFVYRYLMGNPCY